MVSACVWRGRHKFRGENFWELNAPTRNFVVVLLSGFWAPWSNKTPCTRTAALAVEMAALGRQAAVGVWAPLPVGGKGGKPCRLHLVSPKWKYLFGLLFERLVGSMLKMGGYGVLTCKLASKSSL